LRGAPRYFPVIGWITGSVSAILFIVFSKYVSTDIGALATVIAGLLMTGALHENGFAAVCDGFGSNSNREKIITRMNESRRSTFGVCGLILILFAKFLLLKELPQFTPELEHPTSNVFYNYRFLFHSYCITESESVDAAVIDPLLNYVGMEGEAKSSPVVNHVSNAGLFVGAIFSLFPFIFLSWHFLLILLPCLYATWEMSKYFTKLIGGYTDDCLGAVQQVTEIICYLSAVIVWRYIS